MSLRHCSRTRCIPFHYNSCIDFLDIFSLTVVNMLLSSVSLGQKPPRCKYIAVHNLVYIYTKINQTNSTSFVLQKILNIFHQRGFRLNFYLKSEYYLIISNYWYSLPNPASDRGEVNQHPPTKKIYDKIKTQRQHWHDLEEAFANRHSKKRDFI